MYPGGMRLSIINRLFLPDSSKHGSQCEQCCHGHGDSPRDGLGGQEQGQPGHDHEQPGRQVGLEQVVADFAAEEEGHYHAGVDTLGERDK